MTVEVLPRSRLKFGVLRVLDGVEHFDTLELPTIPIQDDDIAYTVLGSDRIDKLAFNFYHNPTLWWVIATANDMELLPVDFVAGRVIRIPAPRFVAQGLFNVAVTRRGRRG